MSLYDYQCQQCGCRFECIVSYQDSFLVSCPDCHQPSCQKLVSGFAILGQGDQREGTLHGCEGSPFLEKQGSLSHKVRGED